MKVAHLIMAHKNPGQVERLVKRLSHEGFDFYIHLDKKADKHLFAHIGEIAHVRFTRNRFLVRWAGYSFTHAILACSREILEQDENYDFINLLSAQDYPIKSSGTIHGFLKNNIGYSFLSFEAFGSKWWESAIARIEHYHTTDFQFKGQYRIQALVNRLLPKRKFPLPYTLYGGACGSWWTMSRECLTYVINFLDNNPKLRHFCRYTWCPDEFLIATIIMNSPLKSKVINNNMRYIDWSQGGPNPKILTVYDLEQMQGSDHLIARKFDLAQDTGILDLLDEINQQEHHITI